ARLDRAYGLRMKLGGMNGRVVSLKEAGVAAILLSDLPSSFAEDFDGRGNGLSSRPGAAFVRADGSRGSYADLWFHYEEAPAKPAAARPDVKRISQPRALATK